MFCVCMCLFTCLSCNLFILNVRCWMYYFLQLQIPPVSNPRKWRILEMHPHPSHYLMGEWMNKVDEGGLEDFKIYYKRLILILRIVNTDKERIMIMHTESIVSWTLSLSLIRTLFISMASKCKYLVHALAYPSYFDVTPKLSFVLGVQRIGDIPPTSNRENDRF